MALRRTNPLRLATTAAALETLTGKTGLTLVLVSQDPSGRAACLPARVMVIQAGRSWKTARRPC